MITLKRYFWVHKKNISLFLLIIALILVSSYTQGNTSKTTAMIAGAVMIFFCIRVMIWLFRLPSKSDKDAIV